MKRLMIMAAGTGGHIFPGLAIAETMHARGWEVSWLGTAHGMERDIVPQARHRDGHHRLFRHARQGADAHAGRRVQPDCQASPPACASWRGASRTWCWAWAAT